MSVKGIDVSKHNGVIDFKKVKDNGIDFVIIRAGIGISNPKDEKFELNYNNAKAAGLDVGCYWFLRALTPDTAIKEAQTFLNIIKDKKFEYPVYLDFEEDPYYGYFPFKTGKTNCSAMVDAFCSTVEKAGYWVGLYMSKANLETYITAEIAKKYTLWIAQWSSQCTYKGDYGMWQYTDKGRVSGITTAVDLDIAYTDFPATVKLLNKNGYKKSKGARLYIDFSTVDEALQAAKLFKNPKVVELK